MSDLISIQQKILAFRNARDWAQFHDPKNLAEALSIEAEELLENYLADIFVYLTYLSEEYKIDLLREVEKKIAVNEEKYPVEKAKGLSKKYSAVRSVSELFMLHGYAK